MDDPIRTTRTTYDAVADAFLENTRDRSRGAARMDAFAARVGAGAAVLDLGAGPGCDSAELRRRGLRAVSVDLSIGMLRAGAREFPGARVQADLRALPFAAGCVDGVWANASLLHLPPEGLREALREIGRVGRAGAAVHVSVKKGSGAGWERQRYGRPRWFQYWSAAELDGVLTDLGWTLLGASEESTRRDDWLVRLAAIGP
ncbi:MAG: class I SAM-dependent methyltransferase [Myxococcota bacterium]